jgi:enamine deaminase RidA (YjgF/YER057c/UK114 family)
MKIFLLLILWYSSWMAPAQAQEATHLQKDYINPANGYTQVVAITTGKIKIIYISGQVGEGEAMEVQVRAAFRNLETQLQAAGATLGDLVKTTTFFVNYQPAHLETFKQVRKEFLGEHHLPASTVVGVQALASERLLVEIEAVAVVELE